jgi:hypothetical protein
LVEPIFFSIGPSKGHQEKFREKPPDRVFHTASLILPYDSVFSFRRVMLNDPVIVLAGIVLLLKMIPKEVMEETRQKARPLPNRVIPRSLLDLFK